jgi:hypothetical protein
VDNHPKPTPATHPAKTATTTGQHVAPDPPYAPLTSTPPDQRGSARISVVPPIPRINHPLFARFFDRFAAKDEARGQAELRGELLAGLAGRVIEIGAGNGLNFRHYPVAVEELIALEPEPYLRVRAAEAAAARRS